MSLLLWLAMGVFHSMMRLFAVPVIGVKPSVIRNVLFLLSGLGVALGIILLPLLLCTCFFDDRLKRLFCVAMCKASSGYGQFEQNGKTRQMVEILNIRNLKYRRTSSARDKA